jgi:hypothetical protein
MTYKLVTQSLVVPPFQNVLLSLQVAVYTCESPAKAVYTRESPATNSKRRSLTVTDSVIIMNSHPCRRTCPYVPLEQRWLFGLYSIFWYCAALPRHRGGTTNTGMKVGLSVEGWELSCSPWPPCGLVWPLWPYLPLASVGKPVLLSDW